MFPQRGFEVVGDGDDFLFVEKFDEARGGLLGRAGCIRQESTLEREAADRDYDAPRASATTKPDRARAVTAGPRLPRSAERDGRSAGTKKMPDLRIVSEELWNAVQTRLAIVRKGSKNP